MDIKNIIHVSKHYVIVGMLVCIICTNTISVLCDMHINSDHLNLFSMMMPIVGFHIIAFIISFTHWVFDTWTVKHNGLRTRTFNQAKTHHYYPHLVVKKDFFSRNDDAIYGSLFFGSMYMICNPTGR